MGPSEGGLLGNEEEGKRAAVKGPTEPTEVLLVARLSTRLNLRVRAACKCPSAAVGSPLGCVVVSLCAGGEPAGPLLPGKREVALLDAPKGVKDTKNEGWRPQISQQGGGDAP